MNQLLFFTASLGPGLSGTALSLLPDLESQSYDDPQRVLRRETMETRNKVPEAKFYARQERGHVSPQSPTPCPF